VASSKEVTVIPKPKDVESQPEVRSVSQPETSQSSVHTLAAANMWASSVVEGSRSQPKTERSRKSTRVETISQPETSQSAKSALAATIRWVSSVVEGSLNQPKTKTSRKIARSQVSQSARNQLVSRLCPGSYI